MPDNEAICLAGLRDTDRDRYLAALLSPVDKRAGLVALYGFNAEIARIRDAVREPMSGEVRLQYWRDLVSGVEHGETAANPLGALLVETIRRYDLPAEALLQMLDARVFDLYDDPMESRGMFEGYAGDTASAVIQLASLIVAPDEAAKCAERAGHAGVAQAVAGSILLLPRARARGQLYIPLEILKAVGLDREGFLAGEDRTRISAVVEAFAGLGREHLAKARGAGALPATIMPAYLSVALVGDVLDRAVKEPARVFEEEIRAAQWRRQLLLMRAMFRRRV